MASRSINHPVSRIGQGTGRNTTPGNARKMGSRKEVFDSQTSKVGVSMQKNQGQPQGKAPTSGIKKNSALTDASNSIRQPPRKKQYIPFNKPMQSGSVNPGTSQKVERRTRATFVGKHIRLRPDKAENVADYQTDDESSATESLTRESVTKKRNSTFNESPRNVPVIRQSPRKKQVTDVDPVRFASPKVGRRTGEAAFAGKRIKIMPDGFENFEDYWTDESTRTEPSTRESLTKGKTVAYNEPPRSVPKRHQSPRKMQVTDLEESVKNDAVRFASPKVGRRTGEAAFAGKRIRINPDGFENFEDYWTDNESTSTEFSTRESVTKAKTVSFNESPRNVPERRQSPRKKQVTNVEESVKSDPLAYALPKVGRRTGKAAFAGKQIRLKPDGTEIFEDYWTDEASKSSLTESNITLSESSSNNDDEPEKVMLDKACSTSRNVRVNDTSLIGIRNKKDSFEHRQTIQRKLFSNELSLSKSPKKRDKSIGENSLNENIFKENEKVTQSPRKILKKRKSSTSTSSRKRSQLFEDLEVACESAITEEDRVAFIRSRNEPVTIKSRKLSHSKNSRSSRRESELIEEVSGDSGNEFDDIPSTIGDKGGPSTHSPPRKTNKLNTSKSKRKNQAIKNDAENSAQESKLGTNELEYEKNATTSKELMKKKQRSARNRSKLIDDDSEVSSKEYDDIPSTRDEGASSTHSPSRKTNKLNTSKAKRKNQAKEIDTEESAQENRYGATVLAPEENVSRSIESKNKKQRSARNRSRLIDDDSVVSGKEFDDDRVNAIRSIRDEEGASTHSTSRKAQESKLGTNELEYEENATTSKELMKKKQRSARNRSKLIDDDSEVSSKEYDDIPSTRNEGASSTHSPSRKTNKLNTSKAKRKNQAKEIDTEESAQENRYGATVLASEENVSRSIESKNKKQRSARNRSRLIDDDSIVSGKEFDDDRVNAIRSIRDEEGASTHSTSRKAQESKLGTNELEYEENATTSKELMKKKQRSARNRSKLIDDDSEVSSKEYDDIPSTRNEGASSTHSPSRKTNKLNTSKAKRKNQAKEIDTEESAQENRYGATVLASEENVSRSIESKNKKQRSARNRSRLIDDDSVVSGKECDDDRVNAIPSTRDEEGASTHSTSRKAQESKLGTNELEYEENATTSKELMKKKQRSARNRSRLIDDDSEVSGKEFDNTRVNEKPSTREDEGASMHSPSRKSNKFNTSKSKRKSQVMENDAKKSAQESECQMSESKNSRASRSKRKLIKEVSADSGNEFDDIRVNDIPSKRGEEEPSTNSPAKKINKLNTSKLKRKSQVVEYDTKESARENELDVNNLASEENAPTDQESMKKKQRPARNKRLISDDSEVSDNDFDDRVRDIPSTRDKVDGDSTDSPSRQSALSDKWNELKSKRKSQVAGSEVEDSAQENELDADELASHENAPSGKKSKKKKHDESPPQQLRRSKRGHVGLLASWLGIRRKLRIVNGEILITGIDPGRWEDNGAKNAIIASQRIRQKNTVQEKKSKPKSLPKTTVMNPQTNEMVEVNLHRPFDFMEWSAVRGAKDQKAPYYLTKTFSSERVTFGFLDICPLEQKSSQYSPEDNIHFVVQKGHVKVVIRKTDYEFRKNDSFIVPCTEAYSIQNLGKTSALLAFCTFKIPFFPYQSI